MKAQDRRQELAQRASAFGWSLSEEQVDRMLAYLDGVLRENARVNLTRVTDPSEAIERHLLDSLAIGLTLKPDEREDFDGDLLDLGTGGGFPGVPAAIALPNWRVQLVEGRGRRLETVLRLADEVGVGNVIGRPGRLADLHRAGLFSARPPQMIIARAVAVLQRIVREAAPCLALGGTLVCWKSVRLSAEERDLGMREARKRRMAPLADIVYLTDRKSLLVRYSKGRTAS